jgi:hypothetical protein
MEYDPKATGWIGILDFICLIVELPPPFGNEKLTKMCKFTPRKFKEQKNSVYNKDSFYINEEKCIIIKNKDILQILSKYKIHTYQGKANRVHWKDVYQILVKKVFQNEFDDFEISKYLKTKMKNQWLDKHKRVKELNNKTGFKIHQSYASEIISGYVQRFKHRRAEKQR